jgi:hypothetical protein
MSTYDEIMAGVEAQGIREEFEKEKARVIDKIELLTGQQAKAKPMSDIAALHEAQMCLEDAFRIVTDYTLQLLVERKEKLQEQKDD